VTSSCPTRWNVADFASLGELLHKRLRWMVVIAAHAAVGTLRGCCSRSGAVVAGSVGAWRPAAVALAYWGRTWAYGGC